MKCRSLLCCEWFCSCIILEKGLYIISCLSIGRDDDNGVQGHNGRGWGQVADLCIFLMAVKVPWVCAYVKTSQLIYFKQVQDVIYQSHLIKDVFKKSAYFYWILFSHCFVHVDTQRFKNSVSVYRKAHVYHANHGVSKNIHTIL